MDLKSKEFKDLQSKWYGRLETAGFKDAEQPDGNLKVWHSRLFTGRPSTSAVQQDAKEEYYRLAGQFLHSFAFISAREKFFWEQHSLGVSIRNIVIKARVKGHKAHRNGVNAVLQRLAKEMLKNHKVR